MIGDGVGCLFPKLKAEELRFCKRELQKSKDWIQKLKRAGVLIDDAQFGGDEGEAVAVATALTAEDVDELLREADEMCVDLSYYKEKLKQISTCYCLCRQLYFGQMIGCDICDEWYHLSCIGLTTAQAEKCEKFICIRCSIHQSFQKSVDRVADLANKWMNCVEHFRIRDQAHQKVTTRP